MCAYYPDSKVEITGITAKLYDTLMNVLTLGKYGRFIEKAISLMEISEGDRICDFGAGTGRNACLMAKYIGKEGKIVGLDISDDMIKQFKKRCEKLPNVEILKKRIDIDIDLEEKSFDKVFISFVLHGFPHDVRLKIVENAYKLLKDGGRFFILDYNEFDLNSIPSFHRFGFKAIECKYAFSFIEKDWKEILKTKGFKDFNEHFFFKKYVRLLSGKK